MSGAHEGPSSQEGLSECCCHHPDGKHLEAAWCAGLRGRGHRSLREMEEGNRLTPPQLSWLKNKPYPREDAPESLALVHWSSEPHAEGPEGHLSSSRPSKQKGFSSEIAAACPEPWKEPKVREERSRERGQQLIGDACQGHSGVGKARRATDSPSLTFYRGHG